MNALEQAQRFTPFDPSPWVLEGAIRMQALGDTKQAIPALKRAINLDASDPMVMEVMVQLCNADFDGRSLLACKQAARALQTVPVQIVSAQ